MSIGAITPVYYVPVTPAAPVRASSRTPDREPAQRSEDVEPRKAPPPPPPASRPPPEQGRLFDIRA